MVSRLMLFIIGPAACLLLVACGDDGGGGGEQTDPVASTKEEARAAIKAGAKTDYCKVNAWYGDGECDDFCPELDSDCGDNNLANNSECLADCDEACPPPAYWVCGSDGVQYCDECVISCHGLTVADRSVCGQTIEDCERLCGVGCPDPSVGPCASDGAHYCNECIIYCHDLTVAEDSTCE